MVKTREEIEQFNRDNLYAGAKREKKALFSIAPPAAGKSTIFNTFYKQDGYVSVTIDDTVEKLFNNDLQGRNPGYLITKEQYERCYHYGFNIFVDGTGQSYAGTSRKIREAHNNGYTVKLFIVHVSKDECARRAAKRERSMPDNVVKNMYSIVQKNIPLYKKLQQDKLVDEILEYDNSSRPPRKITT